MASHNDKHRVYRTSRHHLELTLDRVQTFLTPEEQGVVQVYLELLPQLWSSVEGRPLSAQRAKTLAEAARSAKIAASKGATGRALTFTHRAICVVAGIQPDPKDIALTLGKLPDLTVVNLTALPGKPGHVPGHKPRPPRPKTRPLTIVDKLEEN